LRNPGGSAPLTRDEVARGQRERILRATGELVVKRGYHRTTVEMIVRKARVGYATFYKNFSGKEECFLTYLDQVATDAIMRIGEAAAVKAPWPEQVAAGLRTLFELAVEDPVAARVLLVESLTAGPKAVLRYEMALRGIAPIIRPGRRFNPDKAELPETLEDTLVGGVLWILYQRLIVGESDRLPDVLPETLEFVLAPYIGEEEAVRVAGDIAVRTT